MTTTIFGEIHRGEVIFEFANFDCQVSPVQSGFRKHHSALILLLLP